MSSFRECVQQQLENSRVPKAKVNAALRKYDDKVQAYIDEGVNPAAAEARAGDEVTRETMVRLKLEEARKTAQAIRAIELSATFNRSDIDLNPGERLKALISPRPGSRIQSYEVLRDVYRGHIYAKMTEIMNQFGAKGLGVWRSERGLHDIIRELYGVDTGNQLAKQMAKSWTEATDLSVDLYRQVGGALVKREDWLIGQHQSPARMIKRGKEAWIDEHLNWLDWSRIRRPDASLVPPNERRQYLSDVFDTLSTNGANKISGGKTRLIATGDQLDAQRQLIYKDADSWLAMHEKYQDGNVFDVMVKHVESRAHHIAMMQVLGPSPTQGAELAIGLARQQAAQADVAGQRRGRKPALSKVSEEERTFRHMFNHAQRLNRAEPESLFAAGMGAMRNIITSAYLGSASLIAIPGDFANAAHVKAFNKLPQTRQAVGWTNFMNPLNQTDRQIAQRTGFVDESRLAFAYSAERFGVMTALGPQWSRRITDTALRASLLTGHTQSARFTSQMEMAATLAEHADMRFEDLPFRTWLEQNDITARDWDEMRALPLAEPRKGVKLMSPGDVFEHMGTKKRAYDLHRKFMGMIVQTSKEMIPEATIESSVFLRRGTESGTFAGEIMNSIAMFKSFPVTYGQIHWRRALLQASAVGAATYLATLFGAMTTAGLIGEQARQISQGKDPLPLDSIDTWGTAMLRGGGLGIIGDLLFQGIGEDDPARAAGALAGPVVEVGFDFTNLTLGNLVELARGDDTNFQTEAVKFARDLTPGHSIWYGRLLFQRLIYEQMMQEADPRAWSRAKRMQERYAEESGTEFWFEPGDTSPDRAPELFE